MHAHSFSPRRNLAICLSAWFQDLGEDIKSVLDPPMPAVEKFIDMFARFSQDHVPAARSALEGLSRLSHGLVAGMRPAGLALAVEIEECLKKALAYPWVAHLWET